MVDLKEETIYIFTVLIFRQSFVQWTVITEGDMSWLVLYAVLHLYVTVIRSSGITPHPSVKG